ncbi:membrane protein insertase YidC [Enterococcus pallens]|uniref:Membrane protein insertase YidC n=1 Tax=Enterococcus pallens ATCC BAA-351 TaxID=1158607 RepID=R2S144_9ENTE|nr:membrane protein insertase YidC [Enterococcus pallens]EOH86536.1 YidC/Oxa1 family membrane protein insertase [Enterococcus pallens ATCC BAA-351]EOU18332.1 preprotein translocase subunit YidC [Enterococcus pallens ATCC BAA-351]
MNKMKKWLLGTGLLSLVVFLSGCVRMGSDGKPDTSGIVYRFLVVPLESFLEWMVHNFNWSYGLAIIVLTIIVRLIIMPLGINQSKKSLIQTEKMQSIKPQVDAAQAKLKEASTPEEQMEAQREMQAVYKENNVSMMGGIGCLPLLIQMPIFSALYYTARFSTGIQDSVFLGIDLAKPSYILVVFVGVAYLLQSYISLIGVPEEQKKTMRSMMIASPLMIVFMTFSSPAGVGLYWVVGGIFSCIQTFITNVLMRPRIKAQIKEDLAKNPPKQVVTPQTMKKAEPIKPKAVNQPKKSSNGRNAGKQKRK